MSAIPELSSRTDSLLARCRGLSVSDGLFPHICHAFASKRIPVKDFAVCFYFIFVGSIFASMVLTHPPPGTVSHCSYHDIHVANVSLRWSREK